MVCKFNNITNKQIGSLCAISPTDRRVSHLIVWQWKCVYCGKIIEGTLNQITMNEDSATSKYHCNCPESLVGTTKKTNSAGRKVKDITGECIGSLVADKPTNNYFHDFVIWEWKCKYCGTIVTGTYNQILRGKNSIKSNYHCHCEQSTKNLKNNYSNDLKGTVIGNLIAVSPSTERDEKTGAVIWTWRCIRCGTIIKGDYRKIKGSERTGKYRCNCDHKTRN